MWLCRRLNCIEFLCLLPYPHASSSLHGPRAAQQSRGWVPRLCALQRSVPSAVPAAASPAPSHLALPRCHLLHTLHTLLCFHGQDSSALVQYLASREYTAFLFILALKAVGLSRDRGARAVTFPALPLDVQLVLWGSEEPATAPQLQQLAANLIEQVPAPGDPHEWGKSSQSCLSDNKKQELNKAESLWLNGTVYPWNGAQRQQQCWGCTWIYNSPERFLFL